MKILTVICAALGYDTFRRCAKSDFWKELHTVSSKTVFPALTSPVQASLRTGLEPSSHGIPANGFFDRNLRKTFFWEQSSGLYEGERLWGKFRNDGGRVAQICLQQSLGNDSDVIISPAPIHKHHGGMIQDCYSKPQELYRELCSKLGHSFNLYDYWGPFTSARSTEWIADCTAAIMDENLSEVIFTYLPHLDYDLQRHGPKCHQEKAAFGILEKQLIKLLRSAKTSGYEFLILGDYSIERAERVIHPNRILFENNIFCVREIGQMLYPDMHRSGAFALCDHQIAHVYLQDRSMKNSIKDIFRGIKGVQSVLEPESGGREGDLLLTAEHGSWFSYRWWRSAKEAPEYACHVDIHSKPGFDPCELFFSIWPPFSISLNENKVKGTHGLSDGSSGEILCASSFKISDPSTLVSVSSSIRNML
ncbi:MAG TPA: alkaline phosphatase family protein [Victivallales bacterium]|nr:alkaline phosphatase family protein [Victivallales bacterium]